MKFRDDRGSAVAEIVILTPVLFLILFLIVFLGRVITTQQDVYSAARDGARAGSLRGTPDSAQGEAIEAVERTFGGGDACPNQTIDVDLSNFEAGGQITVAVSCDVSIQDVTGSWLPSTRTVTHEATSVVDQYRGGDQ